MPNAKFGPHLLKTVAAVGWLGD